jgi:hypothetical protein
MSSEQYFSYIQDENELNKIEKREVLFQKDPSPILFGKQKIKTWGATCIYCKAITIRIVSTHLSFLNCCPFGVF